MAIKEHQQAALQDNTSALMAVLFADLVSFTRHMARDEKRVLAFMEMRLAAASDLCGLLNGRLVKNTGDGFLAVFPTASLAVEFAMTFREGGTAEDADGYAFRIGVHSGEVQQRGEDVFGHAVNVASRLEGFAPEGGVCVSHDVLTLIRHSCPYQFESIGAHRLKNVEGHHMLYSVHDATMLRRDSAVDIAEIETLGGLTIVQGESRIDAPLQAAARATLGYLALCPGHSEGVARLSAVLELNKSEKMSRAPMQSVISELQACLGDAVECSGGVLRLDPHRVRVDLVKAEGDLRRGRLAPFLVRDVLWSERLLVGTEDVSPQFASWLAVARLEWKERFAILLETELGRFNDGADVGVRDVASALLAIENAHERAARWLIRHHVATGNPGAGQRVFDRIAHVLRERYGIAPRPETTAALQGMAAPETPVVNLTRAFPLRLQVRRFYAEDPALADRLSAFRSELMAGLACFRGWSVVEGVQEDRGEEETTDYAVTMQQTSPGDVTRVDFVLTEIGTGRLVWSDTFDIGSGRFDLARRQVIGRIAATLEVFITTDRTGVQGPDGRHEIIDNWLRGERLIGRWTPKAHDEVSVIFASLIQRAPEFAPAYASLASILNVRHVVRPGLARDADSSRQAHRLADRALEIDPLDARNQLAAGWAAALDGAFDKASINFDMATRLNPHSPRTLMSCAMGFSFLGEHGRATEHLGHSLDCAPMLLDYQWCYAASVQLLAGNAEAALESALRSGDKIIDNPGWTAAALVKLGRRSEAAVAYSKLVREVSENWCGPEPATPQSVRDWFVSAYPLRNAAERALLEDALTGAMQGVNMPPEGV